MESGKPSTPTTRPSAVEVASWGRMEPCGGLPTRLERRLPTGAQLAKLPSRDTLPPRVYFALSRLANRRYAPGTPAGSCRNHEYAHALGRRDGPHPAYFAATTPMP